MSFLGLLSFYVLALTIWFKTDAVAEYARLLNLSCFKFQDFYLVKETYPTLTYVAFLKEYYDCFFVRLVVCPVCLGTVSGVVISPLSICLCGWWAPSLLVVAGLFLFFILAKLVDTYERF